MKILKTMISICAFTIISCNNSTNKVKKIDVKWLSTTYICEREKGLDNKSIVTVTYLFQIKNISNSSIELNLDNLICEKRQHKYIYLEPLYISRQPMLKPKLECKDSTLVANISVYSFRYNCGVYEVLDSLDQYNREILSTRLGFTFENVFWDIGKCEETHIHKSLKNPECQSGVPRGM